MKKLKIWSIIMLMVMAIPLMVACGGDDSSSGDSYKDSELISRAIGTWMCTQSEDTGQGQTYQGLMVGKEVTIYANGTYSSTASSFGYTGTYTVSGNKITARSNNGSTFVITASISGDRMTWDGTASNGVTFKYIFVREDEASHQAIIPITNEMISSTSWRVKNINIERGKSSSIQNGKVIKFNGDGTCQGFHSMETAWRINSGRIETFYKKTNEPIYVYTLLSQNGDEVQVRVNGTLDDDLQAILTMKKEIDQATYDDTTTSIDKETVDKIIIGCYSYCIDFEKSQINLEKIRTTPSTTHNINSASQEIYNTWEAGYLAIRVVNTLLSYSSNMSKLYTTQELNELLAEARFIRAFVYYNIAMLWGNVPLILTPSVEIGSSYSQSQQSEVINYCNQEINEIMQYLNPTDDKIKINRDAARLLKAEIEMTLGNKMQALQTLNQINKETYEGNITSTNGTIEKPVIWALRASSSEPYIPVYTNSHMLLFEKEISGNNEGLETEWQNTSFINYGYWAALKRIGKANMVTGCYDYELLMPLPANEIANNPNIKQNLGY